MNDLTDLKEGWGPPVPPSHAAYSSARAALLQEIEAARPAPQAPALFLRRRAWLGRLSIGAAATVAATAAVAIAFAGTLFPDPSPPVDVPPVGQASGPPPPEDPPPTELTGTEILLAAANTAESLPEESGEYWYVEQRFDLDDGEPVNTLRIWQGRDGRSYRLPEGWDEVMVDLDVGFRAGGSLVTLAELEQLPTEPAALEAWIADSIINPSHDPDYEPSFGVDDDFFREIVTIALIDLLWEVPVTPEVRAAALRAIANAPYVTSLGTAEGGGEALRISFTPPDPDKFVDGTLPPDAGQVDLVIEPATAMLLSWTSYQGTVEYVTVGWADDLPEVIIP